KPAAVDLAEVDRMRLEQLLEHDSVGAVFTGRNADAEWTHRRRDRGVAEHIVRTRRLLDPPRPELRELGDALDRFAHTPLLVRVDHHGTRAADFPPHRR